MKQVWLAIMALVLGAGSVSAQSLQDVNQSNHYDSYYSVYPTGTFWTQANPTGMCQSGDASGFTLYGLAEALWQNSISTSNGYAFQIEFLQEQPSGTYIVTTLQACTGPHGWPSYWVTKSPNGAFYPGNANPGTYQTMEIGLSFQPSLNSIVPPWYYVRYLSLGWSGYEQYAQWASGQNYWTEPNGNGFYWIDNGQVYHYPFIDRASGAAYVQSGAKLAYVPGYANETIFTGLSAPGNSYNVTRYIFLSWWTDSVGNLIPPDNLPNGNGLNPPILHIARYGVQFSTDYGLTPVF